MFTCPGFVFCPRKPYLKGKGILFSLEVVEWEDEPTQMESEKKLKILVKLEAYC